MSDSVRFTIPIKKARPRGARLIEGYSPKLGRRVSVHSRAAFELWLGLEADPSVLSFCERPALMTVEGRERPLDLWMHQSDREIFLVLADDNAQLPADWLGIPVRRIDVAELAATRQWTSNWERMLPAELEASMQKTTSALEELWDPYASQYFSRDFITHKLLKEPSVAAFMPLYAGTISQERAEALVKLLENENGFGPAYPIPSVPLNSPYFDAKRYWQGPSWVNTNWLIIDGLKRYGFKDHARALTETTLEMVAKSGCAEYFDPLTGEAAGADNFSWTAALTIDLAKSN